MKQALHIFAKDARRLWPEITVVLAVTALFAWLHPYSWTPRLNTADASGSLRALASLTAALLPVSWWILIVRLVQGENLVGDKQWWVTKPCEWPQLLAAKVLFLVVFVAAPLLLAQWTLLARAGLAAFGHLPGQAYDLLLIALVLLAPAMALAAVTATFVQVAVTALAALLITMVAMAVTAWKMGFRFQVSAPDALSIVTALILLAAIVLMYARRPVAIARLVLVSSLWPR